MSLVPGVYRLRTAQPSSSGDMYMELKDGAKWSGVQLAKLKPTSAAQKWNLSKEQDQWILDNESQDNEVLSPLANNSNGQLFGSGLKSKENSILRWKLFQYEGGIWRIENVAFHDKVVDLQEGIAQPGQPIIIYPGRDETVDNQRWHLEKVED
ncbi:hypothetical protein N7537_011903 [Penicillium hordei]|uniref:Ricin B lectin domain-containing protein n=1 Tax=Penicillium hordei TaxID=40994 RepID=A0AAD6DNC7_9EURO|nr:uncharacterized protein N7537_011903 [Penicillium hordei]KAJ5589225.1 hypothetical protein N7537_011903 [Penicillium hordei]